MMLVFLVTVVLSLVGFSAQKAPAVIVNPWYTFYLFEGKFIWQHLSAFISGFAVTGLYVFIRTKYKAEIGLGQKIGHALTQAIQIWILGLLLSSILLFTVAILELNLITVIFNTDPGKLGITVNSEKIVNTLKTFERPPKIITSDQNQKTEIYSVAQALAGKDSIYGNFLIPAVPKELILPVKKLATSMFLIDDALVIKEINPKEMQNISPVMGYLFAQRNFPSRKIINYPNIAILSKDKYLEVRKAEYGEKLAAVSATLTDIKNNIASLSAEIDDSLKTIDLDKKAVTESYNKMDAEVAKCLNEGYYKNREYIKTKTETECNTLRDPWNELADQANNEATSLTKKLETDKTALADNQYLEKFYQEQIGVGEALMNNIPQERGAFDAPENINLVVPDRVEAKAVADYFEILTHEYLHYASYVSDQKKLADPFFEEGLTEFYARTAIKENLSVSTNLGYPAVVRLIEKMSKRISDSDLINIYFSKDQEKLVKILDRVYGNNFYRNYRNVMGALLYTTDQKQLLKLANMVMDKIGGDPLTEKDLLSSFSSY